jgi:murein DD-endopeptidase MepM/ murein hydrolase activator NlpD
MALPARAGTFVLEGNPIQGGIMFGRVDPGCVVDFESTYVKVRDDGIFVIGFKHDHKPWSVIHTQCPDGSRRRQFLQVEERKYDEEHIDGLPPKMVTPDDETLVRINADAARVKAARWTESDLDGFLSAFVWPVRGPISGNFGARRVLNGEPRSPHFGTDIAVAEGTPVMATADGVVRLAESLYYSGNTIILDHGHGISSSYLHLAGIDVLEGQTVTQGQRIGAVGATGRATGPHLDWRFNWFQTRLDPALVAGPMPE